MTVRTLRTHVRDAAGSLRETTETLTWIWSELLPASGRRHALYALGLMYAGMFAGMAVPHFLSGLITTIGSGARSEAIRELWLIGGTWVLARLVLGWQNYHREWAWNRNTWNIPPRLTELFMHKTLGEHRRASAGIGPEQIEVAKDKAQNIQHSVLFDGSEVSAILVTALIFIWINDPIMGGAVTLLAVVNCIWFFFANHYFSGKIEQIDRDWREAQSWINERWLQVLLVKTSAQESYVHREAARRLDIPLLPDFKLWGVDYQLVDLARSMLNILCLVGVIYYGIIVGWDAGLFAAMYLWINFVKDQLWRVGHIQRHLVEQTERVRAVRRALTSGSAFNASAGIEYKPHGEVPV